MPQWEVWTLLSYWILKHFEQYYSKARYCIDYEWEKEKLEVTCICI